MEPEDGADTLLSMRCGRRIALPEVPATISRRTRPHQPFTADVGRELRLLDAVVTVPDRDSTIAMAFAFRHLKARSFHRLISQIAHRKDQVPAGP
ncbi:hypothetical protein [Streptomyces sp. NPDC101166]|uniref:hypothetical protein n=1 Tax=Streptomyces sp. NPDC101166 TaxID=3366120 RepID=UPI0037FD0534